MTASFSLVPKKFNRFRIQSIGNQKVYIVLEQIKSMSKKLRKVNPREETEAYQKIINWYFAYPNTEMSLSDLSQELKISKTTTNKIIQGLVQDGFLNLEVIGKVWRISCNLNHSYNLTRKIGYNLILIYESGILEEIHQLIPNPKAVVLFGSYRKGDDNEKSDVDIAVETVGNEEMNIMELGVISQLGYRKNVRVNIHVFTRNKVNLNLFANIANGIVLEGCLEVRP